MRTHSIESRIACRLYVSFCEFSSSFLTSFFTINNSTPMLFWNDGINLQYVQDGTKCAEGKVKILDLFVAFPIIEFWSTLIIQLPIITSCRHFVDRATAQTFLNGEDGHLFNSSRRWLSSQNFNKWDNSKIHEKL